MYVFDKLYSLLNVIKNKNAHESNYIVLKLNITFKNFIILLDSFLQSNRLLVGPDYTTAHKCTAKFKFLTTKLYGGPQRQNKTTHVKIKLLTSK